MRQQWQTAEDSRSQCDCLTSSAVSSILEEISQLFKCNVIRISTDPLCQLYSINAHHISSHLFLSFILSFYFLSNEYTYKQNAIKLKPV